MGFSKKTQASLNKVLDKFKAGDVAPIVKIALLNRTEKVPFDNWSLSNKLLAYWQTESVDLRGYKQWLAAGRQVMRGASAAYILVPRIVKQEKENDNGEKEEVSVCIGFFSAAVFPLEVTEGEPVNYGFEKVEPPPLLEVAESLGVRVNYGRVAGGYGMTNVKTGDIVLETGDEQVFFHELAHAVRVKLGLLRNSNKEERAKEEAIAEFTSAVLSQMYGRDISGTAMEYIKYFVNGKDPINMIMSVLGDVEKVLDEIAKVKEREVVFA